MNKAESKYTLVRSITYMALMAAINVIFILISNFVPFLIFLLVFILPFTSLLVTLKCQKRYFIIYAVVTLLLCGLITLGNIADTIFYVFPSIISGFIFGVMIEKEVSPKWMILITTFIQFALTYLSIPIIKLLYNRDFIEDIIYAVKLSDFVYVDYVIPCFIFFLALAQESLSYFIIKNEIQKLGYKIKEKDTTIEDIVGIGVSSIATIVLALTFSELAFVFVLVSYYFAISLIINLILRRKIWIYVSLVVPFLATFILFAVFYDSIPNPFGIFLIGILPLLVGIIGFTNNYLSKK